MAYTKEKRIINQVTGSTKKQRNMLVTGKDQEGFVLPNSSKVLRGDYKIKSERAYTSGSVLFVADNIINENNSNLFWDNTNNRLGVGMNNPDRFLQVNSEEFFTSLTITGGTRANGLCGIDFGSISNNDKGRIRYRWGVANEYFQFFVDDSEKMRIDENGVGIGTTTPERKLDVSITTADVALVAQSTSSVLFDIKAGSTGANGMAGFRFKNSSDRYACGLGRDSKFYISNSSGYPDEGSKEIVFDKSNGYLGINMDSPVDPLTIAQLEDDKGIKILGYDDKVTSTISLYIDSSGDSNADPTGNLQVNSTTGGFVVPRMTAAQVAALTAANGMIVYDTTNNKFQFYENGAWVSGSGLV